MSQDTEHVSRSPPHSPLAANLVTLADWLIQNQLESHGSRRTMHLFLIQAQIKLLSTTVRAPVVVFMCYTN